ncbi:MAG: winged helix-turn-helix transcriptional regulator [Promethearchaeota archaeon]|nr:MAG: winged helix-turn-helix transcriptional regulator [Candidatus Lokiarchaeota archaeon]
MAVSKVLEMDDIDKQIVSLVQKQPNLTHTEIAKRVDRSQPTVGMRIRKLEEIGVLHFQAGMNLKTAEMYFARVDIKTNDPEKIYEIARSCPFMLNAFRLSGDYDISIMLAAFDLGDIDLIVNHHFRKSQDVLKASVEIITDVMTDFVIPINFDFSKCDCMLKEHCWEE